MVAAGVVYEGPTDLINLVETHTNEIVKKYNGLVAGGESAIKGHFFTFVSCYLRDFLRQYKMIADAFETSVTWSNYQKVLDNYYKTVYDAYEKLGYEKRLTYHCFRIA